MKVPHCDRTRRELRRRRRLRVLARRFSLIAAGLVLMVAGVLTVPTPVPIGFFFFAAGLYLLARASKRARKLVTRLRRLVPPFSRGLNRIKPHLPPRLRLFIERSDPE